MKPHIKAKITLYDTHKKVYTGYRPAHLIKPDYLTTGIQQYLEKDWLYPNESNGRIYYILFARSISTLFICGAMYAHARGGKSCGRGGSA